MFTVITEEPRPQMCTTNPGIPRLMSCHPTRDESMIDFVGNTNPGCGPVSDLNTEITPLEPTRNHRPPCGLAACILPIFHGSQVRDTMHTRVATSRYVFSLHQLKSIALMSTQPRFSLVPPRRLRRDSMPREFNCLLFFHTAQCAPKHRIMTSQS